MHAEYGGGGSLWPTNESGVTTAISTFPYGVVSNIHTTTKRRGFDTWNAERVCSEEAPILSKDGSHEKSESGEDLKGGARVAVQRNGRRL